MRNAECGEKGEYHPFVYDGPIFKKRVKFAVGRCVAKDGHWFLEVTAKGSGTGLNYILGQPVKT